MSAIQLQLKSPPRSLAIVERPGCISVTFDFDRVYTFDRAGRLVTFFDAGTFYRRGLDHRLLRKARASDRTWDADVVPPESAQSTYRTILDPIAQMVKELNDSVRIDSNRGARNDATSRARRLLAEFPLLDSEALALDGERFRGVYSPVAILPPDQYLALVVQVTEGCSHNRCRFCSFYRDVPFRVKSAAELDRHVDAIIQFLGTGISLRQSLFLGDANALVVEPSRLMDYLERVRRRFAGTGAPHGFNPRGIYSFVDSFHTGFDRPEVWREYARRGLSGVYLGVESGSDELLRAMNKPTSRAATLNAVTALKRAGLRVGVILIAGLGGEAWAERHRTETATLLGRLPLDQRDLVYFSPYCEDEPRPAMEEFKPDLSLAGRARQIESWKEAVAGDPATARPRRAEYSLREFIY